MIETYAVEGLHVVHVAPPAGAPAGRPPVLLVHGASHGAWCWELWLERLPELGWEAYALSLRNHPGSYAVDERTFCTGLRVDDYADDVAVVARHIGRPCLVMGHSMGGIVVQRFAERHRAAGGRLAGLVLLTAASPGQLGPLRPAPLPTDKPYTLERAVARERYFHTAAPEVRERALDRLSPESPSVMNHYSLDAGVPIDPAAITCPVLSVTAAHDGSTVPRDGRIAAFYGGQHLHLPDDGHDVMLEACWESLLEQVLTWAEGGAGRIGAR
jgi:pimeloyl-ACP methyl ester carboxylesterase